MTGGLKYYAGLSPSDIHHLPKNTNMANPRLLHTTGLVMILVNDWLYFVSIVIINRFLVDAG